MSEITTTQDLKTIKSLQLQLPLSTGVADILPFVYLLIAAGWKSVPANITVFCSLAPPIVGVSTLPAYLRWKRVALKSDGLRIAVIFAIVGIIEPIFFWI